MALHRRFRPVFKKYAPRGTARFAKPLQGPFSLVAKHPQKHKNRPEIGRFSHFNPGAEMHLFSLFSASKSPEKWLYDAICRKKQLFAGSFGSRSHSSCSFTPGASLCGHIRGRTAAGRLFCFAARPTGGCFYYVPLPRVLQPSSAVFSLTNVTEYDTVKSTTIVNEKGGTGQCRKNRLKDCRRLSWT